MKQFVKIPPMFVLLIWVIALFLFGMTASTPFVYVSIILLYFVFWGWLFLVGKIYNGLNTKSPIVNYKENRYFIGSLISFVPIILCWKSNLFPEDLNYLILIASSLLQCGFLFALVNFTTKSYRQFETGKEQNFEKYIPYFVMFSNGLIAIWFVQPKINKLFSKKNE